MTITVAGAGVAGLAVATELVERGVEVRVVERAPGPGGHACSWYAGGMLAPFCEAETAEEPVVRLGRQALDWWADHVPGVVRRGTLVLAPARDTRELDRLARLTGGQRVLDGEGIAALEPDLAGRFDKALYFAGEGHLDPRAALAALEAGLRARGVKVAYGTGLEEVRVNGPVVDARGFAARDVLQDLRGVKGEMLLIRSHDVSLSRPVRLLHPRFPMYIVPRGHGLFMLGATQIESEERSRITARGLVDLLNAAYALNPAFAEAEIVETGCDVRPAFADNLPHIRRRGRTVHVNGLFRHGFLLAPALARMAADAVLDATCKPELMDEDYPERASA